MDTQQKINLEIMRRFEQRNVSFAYPTQTVFFASSPSEANSGAPLN
jgi:small-conductance mechanosensitive channel